MLCMLSRYCRTTIGARLVRYHCKKSNVSNQNRIEPVGNPVLIILPFKDHKSADSIRRQLSDLGKKIDRVLQLVFTIRKILKDLKVMETKPSLLNQQCIVYDLTRNSCDSNYTGQTNDEHNQKTSNLHEQFVILKKCSGNFDCFVYEMLLIRKKRTTLNTQMTPFQRNSSVNYVHYFVFVGYVHYFFFLHLTLF